MTLSLIICSACLPLPELPMAHKLAPPEHSTFLATLDFSQLRPLSKILDACKPALASIGMHHPLSVQELSVHCGIPAARLRKLLSRLAQHGIVRFEPVDGQRAQRPIYPYAGIVIQFSLLEHTFDIYGRFHGG